MFAPIVTEITPRLEAVVHDTFIDDLRGPSPRVTRPQPDRRRVADGSNAE